MCGTWLVGVVYFATCQKIVDFAGIIPKQDGEDVLRKNNKNMYDMTKFMVDVQSNYPVMHDDPSP